MHSETRAPGPGPYARTSCRARYRVLTIAASQKATRPTQHTMDRSQPQGARDLYRLLATQALVLV
jgi:hypothetical protein